MRVGDELSQQVPRPGRILSKTRELRSAVRCRPSPCQLVGDSLRLSGTDLGELIA